MTKEIFISVDIETAGPIPGDFDLLSLGACLVAEPEISFYVEIQPFATYCDEDALGISGLTLEHLRVNGQSPEKAMIAFADWLSSHSQNGHPVFVGFNAPFDWSFVNWYFHRFLKRNPFGFSALDIKAFFMGMTGCHWSETSSSKLPESYQVTQQNRHNSLSDAQAQAQIFAKMLDHQKALSK